MTIKATRRQALGLLLEGAGVAAAAGAGLTAFVGTAKSKGFEPLPPGADDASYDKCIRCGLCADNCPAGAIPKDAPQKVDKTKCISCLRCIQICPQSGRSVPLPLRLAAAATVKKYCTGRKEPKFYL